MELDLNTQNGSGKVVSRSGQKGYLSLDDIGYGEVTGFKGVNCRHDWMPYYKGSTRTYTNQELNELKNEKVSYNGKNISKYEATQIQRKMERQIRNDKKEIAGLEGILTSGNKDDKLIDDTKTKLIDTQNKLRLHNSSLNNFIKETGLKKDNNRLITVKANLTNQVKLNTTIKENNITNRIDDFYSYYKSKTNKMLTPNSLNEILGYDEKPTIVSKEKFNELAINNKYGILERGFRTGKRNNNNRRNY